ncbi:hypothetical protein K9M79_02970 [Candidatus Woesearchaeota archaeon]|nr:hypothetical protein [Candidatus Woesearchaeota archaeon]
MANEEVREKEITELLKQYNRPLSITEIAEKTDIPRISTRIILAKLEGQDQIETYHIGRAKVHKWK